MQKLKEKGMIRRRKSEGRKRLSGAVFTLDLKCLSGKQTQSRPHDPPWIRPCAAFKSYETAMVSVKQNLGSAIF